MHFTRAPAPRGNIPATISRMTSRSVETLRLAFSKEVIELLANGGERSDAPIFVLGMPRTGSTLVERIISSHSDVQSAGELSVFSIEMMKMIEERSGGQPTERLDLARKASALPLEELGKRYLAAVEPIRDGSKHFVDKLPLNSLNIGMIFGALPNAKVIHVVRDPIDACYAIYKYLFKNGYPFSYNLQELAAYYTEYFRLMQHWRDVLPEGWLFDVHYEDIVADLPGEARRLVAYLGLEWQDACEHFHVNRHASTTGSASQVRQPVYGTSVGRWKKAGASTGAIAFGAAAVGRNTRIQCGTPAHLGLAVPRPLIRFVAGTLSSIG